MSSLTCRISALFFLLYFNRLFATLLSYAIRAYTWHYYRVYVDINALQISLLSGRVFFKGIRYHGANETIFIHGGFVTWRYWKRNVQQTDFSDVQHPKSTPDTADEPNTRSNHHNTAQSSNKNDSRGEQGGLEKTIELPCRISINLYGLEWFIYNRTAAYESILAGFGYSQGDTSTKNEATRDAPSSPAMPQTESGVNLRSAHETNLTLDTDAISQQSLNAREGRNSRSADLRQAELSNSVSNMLLLLPLKLDCKKGAIVMGNEHTRSVLTTTFDTATGTIAACNAGP
ncbi:hypothetical protein N7512_000007 [Penicillium capsulatum]|nr:hypothetical protein N7512_000007 [Penicillium capsulatum]